jgi:hypothetical protein
MARGRIIDSFILNTADEKDFVPLHVMLIEMGMCKYVLTYFL